MRQTLFAMLGTEKHFTIVTGEYAEKLRDAIRRRETGELNEEDERIRVRAEQIKKLYRVIWKDSEV